MFESTLSSTVPELFQPYDRITFCGNTLKKVRFLFEDAGYHPIIIGRGDIPLIWLYNRLDAKTYEHQPIVIQTIGVHPNITVSVDPFERRVVVFSHFSGPSDPIVTLSYTPDSIDIEQINLKSIGYPIIGDSRRLKINDNEVFDNVIEDTNAFMTFI